MMNDNFKPKVYLKDTCPFCFKFLLFLSESRILDQFEIITCAGEDSTEMDKYRTLLQEKAGKAIFPTVEISPGKYLDDSDALINHYSEKHNIAVDKLVTYNYYMNGPFPRSLALFRENRALKENGAVS
jgi:hypothetical protein